MRENRGERGARVRDLREEFRQPDSACLHRDLETVGPRGVARDRVQPDDDWAGHERGDRSRALTVSRTAPNDTEPSECPRPEGTD
jgi:hypothetical protein